MTPRNRVLFDDALRQLFDTVVESEAVDAPALEQSVVLRDAAGYLTFFAATVLRDDAKKLLEADLREKLGPYARADRVLADRHSLGAEAILCDNAARRVRVNNHDLRLIDRRIVGAEWLATPYPEKPDPPRLVFASLKGGVGRSTALAVVAAERARSGDNVLVIDLDLEAPGIGSMLLDGDRRPRLGVVDYLVEDRIEAITDEELPEFVGTSQLTEGAGLVDIVPAVGSLGAAEPESFLAKVSRAMLDDYDSKGERISVAQRLRTMVDRLGKRRSYDLVLIDARAGMAELAAGPLVGLGAAVLLFGTTEPQSVEGFRFLFAQLRDLINEDIDNQVKPRWRERLRLVHAKAPLSEDIAKRFLDNAWDLFTEFIYDEVGDIDDGFSFDANDKEASHWPLVIANDGRFAVWDPVADPNQLMADFYDASFRPFINGVEDLLSVSD